MKTFAATTQPSLSNLPRNRSAAHKANKSTVGRRRNNNYTTHGAGRLTTGITSPRAVLSPEGLGSTT